MVTVPVTPYIVSIITIIIIIIIITKNIAAVNNQMKYNNSNPNPNSLVLGLHNN